MTLHLLLIRHAKSDWADASLPDHDRPLNPRGRRDAPRMGAWIAARGYTPQEVLCSDARRTRETLSLMLPAWSPAPEVRYHRALYHATPEGMLAVLAGAAAPRVALIGHNPGMGALMARLARRAPDHPRWGDVPTCAVAALSFEAEGWADVGERQGRLDAFAIPADLT
jgi:phosphohistidine phosphatase